jgi:hypothetical protein
VALDVTTSSSSALTIKWQPPQEPNGNVTHYVVTGSLIKDDDTILDQRNYCNERKYSRLLSIVGYSGVTSLIRIWDAVIVLLRTGYILW